jgi:hypothetical protein
MTCLTFPFGDASWQPVVVDAVDEAALAEDRRRLDQVSVELDQCWDLLRQRRARREFGDDPSQAHARDAGVVKKYIG